MPREIPYGFEAKIFSRSRGDSSVAKAAYRAGASLSDRCTGEVHDFRAKKHVVHSEIMAPASAAAWAFDREELWNRVEAAERRSDAQVAREIRLTLPRELDREQQIALVREWCGTQYVSRGMIADFAIHAPPASDGGEQPHAHIMLTMRQLDAESSFSRTKAREWNDLFADQGAFKMARRGDKPGATFVASTGGLEKMRADWADLENRHLAAAGIDGRVDHRRLEDQRADAISRGDLDAAERLNRPAEPKLRPGEGKRKKTPRASEIDEIRSLKAEVVDLAAERRRRQHLHPEDRKAVLERPSSAQIHEMEAARERIAQARRQVAGGAVEPDRRQNGRPDELARTASRGRAIEGGPAVRTRTAASGAIGGTGAPGGRAPERARRDNSPEAIARRRERARRIAEARAGMATIDSGNQAVKDRYKLRMLQEHYQQEMPPEVAQSLAWVRAREASGEVVVQMRDGARVRDDGAALRAQGEARGSSLAVMIAAARAHGWTEITVTGTRAFQERSAEALTRAGIGVVNPDLAHVVERTRMKMAAKAISFELDFIQTQREHSERRLDQLQLAAQDHHWIGPDGRRRPFLMVVEGLPQHVPARMSEDEVREHLQPGYQAARAAVADLRADLRDRQAEYEALGPLARVGAGAKRTEIERLRADLVAAEARQVELERDWSQRLAREAAELKRQADRQ